MPRGRKVHQPSHGYPKRQPGEDAFDSIDEIGKGDLAAALSPAPGTKTDPPGKSSEGAMQFGWEALTASLLMVFLRPSAGVPGIHPGGSYSCGERLSEPSASSTGLADGPPPEATYRRAGQRAPFAGRAGLGGRGGADGKGYEGGFAAMGWGSCASAGNRSATDSAPGDGTVTYDW